MNNSNPIDELPSFDGLDFSDDVFVHTPSNTPNYNNVDIPNQLPNYTPSQNFGNNSKDDFIDKSLYYADVIRNSSNRYSTNRRKGHFISYLISIIICCIYIVLRMYGVFSFAAPSKVSKKIQGEYISLHQEIIEDVERNLNQYSTDTTAVCKASSYDEFIEVLHQQMTLRKEDITIYYSGGDYNQIVADINNKYDDNTSSTLTDKIYYLDNVNTSNDCDYMRGNIHSLSGNVKSTGTSAIFTFKLEWIENAAQMEYVNTYVNYLITALKLNELSSDEKIISTVHDYLATIITYDKTSDINDENFSEHSAYSGIAKQSTVCSGYALLNYKILTELGIPCRYITSETHAWNIVLLNDKWYHLDITWDDTSDRITDTFYLKGEKDWESHREHIIDTKYKTTDFLGEYPISYDDY